MTLLRALLRSSTSTTHGVLLFHRIALAQNWAARLYSRVAGNTCPGCGATFQTSSRNQAGYIDAIQDQKRLTSHQEGRTKVLRNSAEQTLFEQAFQGLDDTQKQQMISNPLTPVSLPEIRKEIREVCDRCHDISHHRKAFDRSTATQERIFNTIKKSKNPMVVHVVDYSDFPTSFIPDLPRLTNVPRKRTAYVLSRVDRVSRAMPVVRQMKDYFGSIARGLSQYPHEVSDYVFPLSARRPWALTRFFTHVEQHRGDVFFIGHTNVGKSALIGSMPSLGRAPKPLESIVPATTADILQVANTKFEGRIYDTPGLGMGLMQYCLPSEYSRLLDRIPSRKRIIVLPGRCILFEGIALLKYVKGSKYIAVFNHTPFRFHLCRPERAEILMRQGSTKAVTISVYPEALEAMRLALTVDISAVPFKGKYRREIALAGFGWLELMCADSETIVEIHTPHGEGVAERPPIPT